MAKHTGAFRALSLIPLSLALVLTASAQDATPDSTPEAGDTASTGGILRIGTNAPEVLDPAFIPNDSETLFVRSIYDYLVELKPDNSIAPNLATDYTISDDGLTYTFILRNGVTFHDGATFEAADVVYTFNRLVEQGSAAANLLDEFEVSAPDESTVVFTLPQPNADFLFGVASRWALILNEGDETPGQFSEGEDALANFNGTGPFVLESFNPGVNATFSRNADYWDAANVALDGVELVFIDDPVAQVDALRAGEVDFVFKIPVEQAANLEGESEITVYETAGSQHPVIRLRAD